MGCGEVVESSKADITESSILESLDGNKDDLISYGSVSEQRFYVVNGQEESAVTRLNGKHLDSSKVIFKINNKDILLEISPMEKLDFKQNYKEGDFGTVKNAICASRTDAGTCINFESVSTGEFTGSMKVPKGGLSWCEKEKNVECDWIAVSYSGQTWKQKDCKGDSNGIRMLRVCFNNNS